MESNQPDFLIVGAAKAGTTSLYHYLSQHPQIFMSPVKEPDYFGGKHWKLPIWNINGPNSDFQIFQRWDDYQKLYKKIDEKLHCGEASPSSLYYYQQSIPLIKKHLFSPKIIILLRNPVERAYSHYSFFRRDNKEDLTFEEGLKNEENRINNNFHYGYHYLSLGFYYKQVKAFKEVFPQIYICLFEDLKNNPKDVLTDIYRFLEVDNTYYPDFTIQYNSSGIPKNRLLHNFFIKKNPLRDFFRPVLDLFISEHSKAQILAKINRGNLKSLEPIKNETKDELKQIYREDIEQLSKLIGKDLTHWLR